MFDMDEGVTWGLDSVGIVYWNTYSAPFHVPGASCNIEARFQKGASREKIFQETKVGTLWFSDLALVGMQSYFHHILLSTVIVYIVYFIDIFS